MRLRFFNAIVVAAVAALAGLLMPSIAPAAGIVPDAGRLNPPIVDGKPVTVKIGIFLTNLIDIDEVRESFEISGYLFMTWKDPRLAYSSAAGDAQRYYDPDSIWIPRILLINATRQRDKVSISVKGDADGTIHYLEMFQTVLTNTFDLAPFPFDTESLEIYVEPFLDERETMVLTYDSPQSGFSTRPYVDLAQWKVLGVRGVEKERDIGTTGKEMSDLEIVVVVRRGYRYYLWKVFLPLLAMVTIAYSAFWIKTTDYYTQISMTLTAILTEIAFLFAISTSLPKVPYLTFFDVFFLVSFAFSCGCILELILVHRSLEWHREKTATRIRIVSRIVYPIAYIGTLVMAARIFF
jgi:hypothetical protein